MTQGHIIFDRKRLRQHRCRAADSSEMYDFLLREMAVRLSDRLPDIKKTFSTALDFGAHTGLLADHVHINTWVQADSCAPMLAKARGLRVVADEEYVPFAAESFDLVMSAGTLHWVNDVPGALIQIQRILKPGGLFLAILPGGETLRELRESFEQAEMRLSGGIRPRVSPFIDVKDAGSLLSRAGFSEPVTDSERIVISYATPLQLLRDLRGMGQSSALMTGAKSFMRRTLLHAMFEYYSNHFADENGRISATFEFITMTAWK